MKGIEEVLLEIEKLRSELYRLINSKGNLMDKDVVKVSQELDRVLNEYRKLIKNSIDNE
ncbi:Spo0E family sporulation regulatory protein-aspartic acid phosphatase [Clostridium tyrobutyricum]|jgi:ElaB/YqjD/DUF883 family membrane-anchored ribosome-binding protein|uniref:Spo0E like sporulation regulatory protein n=1 Tax=Clostridium tyrobutyricum DIVETGP TaxID=1408889 RepID=W6N5J7_CLOTY|nr:aspartyl-phosphate phosphatase Spo0E family protein [Clostridium tyrobutyricum]AND83521.1 hypothetical protein CTK_C02510 [Clostridium tyrobutyricum]ANP68312.1 sporulation protein Spo0E [Clostridium tyrobutyricum]MBR9647840.1 aspartyl-phosphate phosphatase Spo0E family protein [Clostridium tyrobutyricum]MBV4425741.1 aspartyl-phosphate phosphatase Spo0E family protein [Clostridium tyrobutyricum]MBV4427942.1 aspartyl-phosphate phosphatase Spo0E family protein [Clostridium tyrobutyricum]